MFLSVLTEECQKIKTIPFLGLGNKNYFSAKIGTDAKYASL